MTEQKVRTRDEQIDDLGNRIEGGSDCELRAYDDAAAHILEAEARGREEQRRKDAEGERDLADWIFNNLVWYFGREGYQLIEVGDHLPDNCIATIGDLVENHGLTMVDPKTGKSELANVSGLESKVKELEARQRKDADEAIHIVFDGFPAPEGLRFVEVENCKGFSVPVGEWRKRDDGFFELVIPGQYKGVATLGVQINVLEVRVKEMEGALGKIEYASRKDSLSATERLESVRAVARAALNREGSEE